jgi:hypothetical protein
MEGSSNVLHLFGTCTIVLFNSRVETLFSIELLLEKFLMGFLL